MGSHRIGSLVLWGLMLVGTNCANSESSLPRPKTGIAVTVPASARPGSNATIRVIAARDLDLQQVVIAMVSDYDYLVGGQKFNRVSGSGPWEFSFPIPDEALGDVIFFATGKRRGETASDLMSEKVTLPIDLGTARLTGLIFADPAGCVVDPRSVNPRVVGKFSDGVDRNCSSVNLGTTYSSSNPAVARVDEKGDLYCVSEGSTTLVASYGGMKAQIVLRVARRP